MPSIKVLNISLVLLCILTTAFVCTFLAITSSEKALDDTKESRDVSVAAAFSIGEESVTNRTTEYMNLLMDSTTSFLTEFTKTNRLASQAVAKELMAAPWADVQRWEWHRETRYFSPYSLQKQDGNTGIGMMLANKLSIIHYDGRQTIPNVPPELDYNKVLINYGDAHPQGGYNKTWIDTSDSNGVPVSMRNVDTDVNWGYNTCALRYVATSGQEQDEPCAAAPGWEDPTLNPFFFIAKGVPAGHTLWTSPFFIGVDYVTINSFTPIHHNGTFTGFVFSGAHLNHISEHLSTLEIGGPVAGHPSRGRVFVTLRNTWLDPRQIGRLIGASHGSVIETVGTSQVARYPIDSTDSIISSVANATQQANMTAEDIASSGGQTVLSIETDFAPQGEDFYYRVGQLQDVHSLDWHVHVVIDRQYILGMIDKRTAETRDEIKASEVKVDDNLKEARTILYILIVTVAVALTVLSVVFVLKIIEPLVVLEKEMAAVAVMKLEAVDINRPLSALAEVRLMQVSFLQMIANLVEYRNYMPASVLQDSSSDDDASTHDVLSTEASRMEASLSQSRTSGDSSQGVRTVGKVQMMVTELRTKRVTLMVCNIVGFLKVGGPSKMQSCIGSYLAAGLQHLKTTKGIPDSFSGDRLYASWNGTRSCSSHRTAGYQCANEMCFDKVVGAKLSVGLASGQVTCGNMGCEGMKKYSYIGSLSSWVHVVERIGRSMECDIAIDSTVNEEVSHKAYTRMLQHVEFVKHGEGVLRIYEAMGLKDVAEEEWMYQLEEGVNSDPNRAYNKSYELFMEGNVREALKELQSHSRDSSRVYTLYCDRVTEALENPILCEPLGRRVRLLS